MKANDELHDGAVPRALRLGFTLVEMLISVAVISILAGMAAQTFVVVLNSRDIAMRRIEMNETGRTALDFLGSDLRSAYLTPDSVKPMESRVTANQQNVAPRFRFAGISRDVEVTADSDVPGAGKDDDGDGLIDEEVLDGIDADYPGGAASALNRGRAQPDPRDCPAGDSSCIDEDIGVFPSDILHFVSAVENSGAIMLQEISYGLDPSGTRLIRRAQVLTLDSRSTTNRQKLLDFGQFVDDTTSKRLVPRPMPPGIPVSPSDVREAIDNWDFGSRYGQLRSASTNFTNKNPEKLFQVLAYDIRGMRLRYWYYDYNRGGWRVANEWDSARETALIVPGQKLFNAPALNNSTEGRTRVGFENIIINEPEDVYPRVPGTLNQFLVTNPRQIQGVRDYQEVAERITRRTDGLPNMVEITLYVQDRKRQNNPKPFTSRVFIPNNYRSIGI